MPESTADVNHGDQAKQVIEDVTETVELNFDQKLEKLTKLVNDPNYQIDKAVLNAVTPENIDRLLLNANQLANEQAKQILTEFFSSKPHKHQHG